MPCFWVVDPLSRPISASRHFFGMTEVETSSAAVLFAPRAPREIERRLYAPDTHGMSAFAQLQSFRHEANLDPCGTKCLFRRWSASLLLQWQ